ncbi:hypothetical protein JOC58_001428 [Paenibacillus hunanensis]|uniref:Uncharacterized protein n=1 Tax=Paenibacillus hunanensis TaxID=539262 RepID=A0ABU1IX91_9BACL|nr:hypothetical protein [Paenibacillus hunanensis]
MDKAKSALKGGESTDRSVAGGIDCGFANSGLDCIVPERR